MRETKLLPVNKVVNIKKVHKVVKIKQKMTGFRGEKTGWEPAATSGNCYSGPTFFPALAIKVGKNCVAR